tara:strand:- start:333 stop:587 length:255 start_codon:yes stop_codon:yes gene_type:complete
MGSELEMINQFVNQLAMCELLSAHSLIQPSMAFECDKIQTFIKESYFDNNYEAFIKWWDAVVVPTVGEFQSMLESRVNGNQTLK